MQIQGGRRESRCGSDTHVLDHSPLRLHDRTEGAVLQHEHVQCVDTEGGEIVVVLLLGERLGGLRVRHGRRRLVDLGGEEEGVAAEGRDGTAQTVDLGVVVEVDILDSHRRGEPQSCIGLSAREVGSV